MRQLPDPETVNYLDACRLAEVLEMASASIHSGSYELDHYAHGYRIRAAALLAAHMHEGDNQ